MPDHEPPHPPIGMEPEWKKRQQSIQDSLANGSYQLLLQRSQRDEHDKLAASGASGDALKGLERLYDSAKCGIRLDGLHCEVGGVRCSLGPTFDKDLHLDGFRF